jgi:hypothetical protein
VLVYILGSQFSTVALVAFVAGSEVLLAGTNALLGAGALMASVGTVRWRAALVPRLAPAER